MSRTALCRKGVNRKKRMSPSLAHNAAFQDTEVDEDIAAAESFNHMWSQGSTPGEIDRAEQSLNKLRLAIERTDIPQTSSQSACCPHGPWPKRGVSPPLYPFSPQSPSTSLSLHFSLFLSCLLPRCHSIQCPATCSFFLIMRICCLQIVQLAITGASYT